ncbi:hypothetical protein AArc1_5053 (plasmid) [Natrarchaeobaculum sulfurireducens]|uniref:Uncharacterized protein n=1 Tax=Natrarchaeobaculum sulfurireducens TaxID=2044521 RepID=A0A346P9Q9_9EURY|nr:hypothetical protein AArc1_5053 [Natrarchaeobaculum sulfurireducens]
MADIVPCTKALHVNSSREFALTSFRFVGVDALQFVVTERVSVNRRADTCGPESTTFLLAVVDGYLNSRYNANQTG